MTKKFLGDKNASAIEVLLIEDSIEDAEMILDLIDAKSKPEEFKFKVAVSLKEGVQVLQTNKIDLVLLDLNLPDSNGIATIISLIRNTKDLPVIVCTGSEDTEIAKKVKDQGAVDYVNKNDIHNQNLADKIKFAVETFKASKIHTFMFQNNFF